MAIAFFSSLIVMFFAFLGLIVSSTEYCLSVLTDTAMPPYSRRFLCGMAVFTNSTTAFYRFWSLIIIHVSQVPSVSAFYSHSWTVLSLISGLLH